MSKRFLGCVVALAGAAALSLGCEETTRVRTSDEARQTSFLSETLSQVEEQANAAVKDGGVAPPTAVGGGPAATDAGK